MNTHMQFIGMAREHSIDLGICASLLASPAMRHVYNLIADDTTITDRIEIIGALVDALIPSIDAVGDLLACALADPSLFSDELADYDPSYMLSSAALLYENLYRRIFAWVETSLSEIVRLAILMRRAQDEIHAAHPDVGEKEVSLAKYAFHDVSETTTYK
jgi:hypothetical protein